MILGWYQGIPIGGRVVGERDGQVVVEVYPILGGGPGEGEPMPLEAAA